jgi:hypothetical protein
MLPSYHYAGACVDLEDQQPLAWERLWQNHPQNHSELEWTEFGAGLLKTAPASPDQESLMEREQSGDATRCKNILSKNCAGLLNQIWLRSLS